MVGYVAGLGDGSGDDLAQLRVDRWHAVDDPRHRRPGHPGEGRDLVEGRGARRGLRRHGSLYISELSVTAVRCGGAAGSAAAPLDGSVLVNAHVVHEHPLRQNRGGVRGTGPVTAHRVVEDDVERVVVNPRTLG